MGRRKNPYKTHHIKNLSILKLKRETRGKNIVLGVDVGKEEMFGCVMDDSKDVVAHIKWNCPADMEPLIRYLEQLPVNHLAVVLEPTGTYGDTLAHLLHQRGILVHRVNPKHTHDISELYDGVPSRHDAKSSAILAALYIDGYSTPWQPSSLEERELANHVDEMELHKKQIQPLIGRLEAKLARHWPEVTQHFDLTSATLLSLLETYGSPSEVSNHIDEVFQLMKKVGGHLLKPSKCEAVVTSSKQSIGVPMTNGDCRYLKHLAKRIQMLRQDIKKTGAEIKALIKVDPIMRAYVLHVRMQPRNQMQEQIQRSKRRLSWGKG